MNINSNTGPKNYRNRPLIFLDLEATGLEIESHEIVEIGAIKASPKRPFKILDQLELKIKPKNIKNADPEALKIIDYTPEKWQDALAIKDALKRLDSFAENGVLVGFNVTFDWAFLQKTYFDLGRLDPFHYHRLDVLSMAYQKLYSKTSVKKFSLSTICQVLGVDRGDKHQALSDTKATYLVFKKLMELK